MAKDFSQEGNMQEEGKTIADFFRVTGGVLQLIGTLQTINFLSGKKGVQIDPTGLNATGGTINGATIGGSTGLAVANGGTGATSLTGIIKGNGTSAMTAIIPLAGTKVYWVSDSNGGLVNRKLTFTNGILTAET